MVITEPWVLGGGGGTLLKLISHWRQCKYSVSPLSFGYFPKLYCIAAKGLIFESFWSEIRYRFETFWFHHHHLFALLNKKKSFN